MALIWQIRQTRLHQDISRSDVLEFNLKLDGQPLSGISRNFWLTSLLLSSISKTAHYSSLQGEKSKIFSDIRLEACAVEYYPGQLKQQSHAHHMAVISSGIHT